ncbi:MAG: alpha-ribazole phosphatase [Bacteroidota bacterium]
MEIHLVRHTTPDVAEGVCYGQTDLPLAQTFDEEAKRVKEQLPTQVDWVFSSPLGRCKRLASLLSEELELVDELKEMNFGAWEMQAWSDIPKDELDPWMRDFVNKAVPGGESMKLLSDRVNQWYERLLTMGEGSVIIVSHAGPIRVILSTINDTPLEQAFKRYRVDYGEVITARV